MKNNIVNLSFAELAQRVVKILKKNANTILFKAM